MKTRISLTLLALLAFGWLDRALLTPVSTVVNNHLSVAELNGGDAEFVARQAVNNSYSTASLIYLFGLVAILILLWAKPIRDAFQETK